jgi:adenylate cyclase
MQDKRQGGNTMLGFWRDSSKRPAAMSADFEHALAREVLRTELIRIRALIATALLFLAVLWIVDLLAPEGLDHIWRGRFRPVYVSVILIPFILFELWVHANIRRHLRLDRDVPVLRRYVGALIETTLPTIALAVHIEKMGPVEALGFVMPLTYFIFIILSTLRLDFCGGG